MTGSLLGDLASTSVEAVDAEDDALEPAYFIGSDKRMRFDSMKDAQLALAFKAPPAGSKESYAVALMMSILGKFFGGGLTTLV